jgi:hypothetical protein
MQITVQIEDTTLEASTVRAYVRSPANQSQAS